MVWGRGAKREAVPGRALVVPFQAVNAEENVSNLSADSRVKTRLRLVAEGPGASGEQETVTASLPNWLRVVLHYAGSNEGPAPQLPAQIDVPVAIDPRTGAIVEVDVDAAAGELAAYRAAAVEWWKEDEAPLADLRGIANLPKDVVRGAKGLLGAWRGAVAGTNDTQAAAEAEQSRRTANMLKHDLQRKPKQLTKVRASALQAGPLMVDNVMSGSMSNADFETWLQFQLTSGAITAEEAEQWRQQADVPLEPDVVTDGLDGLRASQGLPRGYGAGHSDGRRSARGLLARRVAQLRERDGAAPQRLVGEPGAARAFGADAELVVQVREVLLDGGLRDDELLGDRLRRSPAR